MHAHFRFLAVHQAHFFKKLAESWKQPGAVPAEDLAEGLMHDGMWLTKFPLLFTPGYGVERLDAWDKARGTGVDAAETLALRQAVDADLVRFVLKLREDDLEAPVEIFWRGRAMNKPLWQYLAAWFEHSAALRGRLSLSPTLLETVLS